MLKTCTIVILLGHTLLLSGCANMRNMGQAQKSGTVLGGGVGAIIGAQFGHGAGRLVGAGVGGAVGAAIGNAVGENMDHRPSYRSGR